MRRKNRRSKLQFFKHLPSEIVIDILSRLPIRTIVICKCVCRSWRDLLLTRDFADFHPSKSVPGLVIGNSIFGLEQKYLKVYEFNDELGLEDPDLHYKPITKIDHMELTGSTETSLQGSADGLVLLHREVSVKCDALYVCNPVICEYIKIRYDRLIPSSGSTFTYGFGVSRMTGQHKVVRILQNDTMSVCLVYTLGTAIWRSITFPIPFHYNDDLSVGVCLNGNLHWLVEAFDVLWCILCFDLETETFSTFSLPSRLRVSEEKQVVLGLVVLGDFLCVSDNISLDSELVIWLIKEYGDEKSWTKEFVLENYYHCEYELFELTVWNSIKVFRDGDILMANCYSHMWYYSNKDKNIYDCYVFEDSLGRNEMKGMLHTSSFFPLSSFLNERVRRC